MSSRSSFPRSQPHHKSQRTSRGHVSSRLRVEAFEDRRMLSFTPAVDYNVGTDPTAVVAADFNNDGRLDLVTANTGSSNVSVLLGNEGGTFDPAVDSSAGIRPTSIAVGDFDDDGNLDLAGVSEATNPFVAVLFGNGNGSFRSPTHISLGRLAGPLSDPVPVPM